VATKRSPAYGAFFVIGLAFIAIALTTNIAFLGVAIVFLIIGGAGLRRQRHADSSDKE
jgi:hypothetical protein